MPKHKRSILNCASGGLPLVKSDFPGSGVGRVINFDPLSEFDLYQRNYMFQLSRAMPDIEYYFFLNDLKKHVRKDSLDAIISVSPYGFPLISEVNNSFLKVNGYVVVIGSRSNPHVNDLPMRKGPFKGLTPIQNPNLFEHPMYHKSYAENIMPAAWILGIANKLKSNVSSHTSNIERTTPLDVMRIFQKVR